MGADGQRTAPPWPSITVGARVRAILGSGPVLRLGRALLVSFGVLLVAFMLLRLAPGDPAALLLGEQATPEAIAELRATLGLNGSFLQQLARYLGGIIHGDLGTSLASRQPVGALIARALPVTLWLICLTGAMALLAAVPLGMVAARYHRTWFGHAFRVVVSVLLATPVFFSGLLLILFFSMRLNVAPVAGYVTRFPKNTLYLWLPALTLCTVLVPLLARVLQSSVIDTTDNEFVETAIVRGLPGRVMMWRYLIRPSIAPTISLFAYIIGQLVGSAVVVEAIFGLPGMGTLLVEAIRARDYPVLQGGVAVLGLVVVVVGYMSDTTCAWIDPRTKAT